MSEYWVEFKTQCLLCSHRDLYMQKGREGPPGGIMPVQILRGNRSQVMNPECPPRGGRLYKLGSQYSLKYHHVELQIWNWFTSKYASTCSSFCFLNHDTGLLGSSQKDNS